jgi:hypothetical protein
MSKKAVTSFEGGDPVLKYFAVIPHMVDDMGLTSAEYRLYGHIVRRCGAGGECFEGVRGMARVCNLNKETIKRAREGLVKQGLIIVQVDDKDQGGVIRIRLVDIMPANVERYSHSGGARKEGTGSPVPSNRTGVYGKRGHKDNPLRKAQEQERASSSEATDPHPLPKKHGKGNHKGAVDSSSRSSSCGLPLRDPMPSWYTEGRKHPAIKAWKEITGSYPGKAEETYKVIIQELGESPDMERLKRTFANWTAKDYNPRNVTGIMDWYSTNCSYMDSSDRITEWLNRDLADAARDRDQADAARDLADAS